MHECISNPQFIFLKQQESWPKLSYFIFCSYIGSQVAVGAVPGHEEICAPIPPGSRSRIRAFRDMGQIPEHSRNPGQLLQPALVDGPALPCPLCFSGPYDSFSLLLFHRLDGWDSSESVCEVSSVGHQTQLVGEWVGSRGSFVAFWACWKDGPPRAGPIYWFSLYISVINQLIKLLLALNV